MLTERLMQGFGKELNGVGELTSGADCNKSLGPVLDLRMASEVAENPMQRSGEGGEVDLHVLNSPPLYFFGILTVASLLVARRVPGLSICGRFPAR